MSTTQSPTPATGPGDPVAGQVLAEQLAGLAGRLPVALGTVVVNSAIVAAVLHRSLQGRLWLWTGAVWLVSAARLWIARSYRPCPGDPRAPRRQRLWFVGGSLANGLCWGALPLFFAALSGPERAFVAVVLVGMSAGAAGSNSSYLPAFLAFLVPALLPLEVQLFRSASAAELAIGVMGLVFVGAMVAIVRQGSRSLVEILGSRDRNRALAEELGAAREELAAANAGLEARVREQTSRLLQVERELAQAALLASIGSLSASVAHEINSPLSSLLANLSWLERELAQVPGEEGTALREAVAEAREGGVRVRDIVRNLGALAAPAPPGPAAADVRETLEACAAVVGSEIRGRARLVREYGEVPRVAADRARLAQVLLGLVLHAVRSVPAGAPERHEIRLRTAWDPVRRQVQVEVSDTGPTLSPEDRAGLFDVMGAPPGNGAGPLGLSLCQALVAQVGGSIRTRGAEGLPNVVEVLLPVAGEPGDA